MDHAHNERTITSTQLTWHVYFRATLLLLERAFERYTDAATTVLWERLKRRHAKTSTKTTREKTTTKATATGASAQPNNFTATAATT